MSVSSKASPAAPVLSRRTAFIGAGAIGAVAAAAAVLPGQPSPPATAAAAPDATAPEGGYRVTEHIQRYYATARI